MPLKEQLSAAHVPTEDAYLFESYRERGAVNNEEMGLTDGGAKEKAISAKARKADMYRPGVRRVASQPDIGGEPPRRR